MSHNSYITLSLFTQFLISRFHLFSGFASFPLIFWPGVIPSSLPFSLLLFSSTCLPRAISRSVYFFITLPFSLSPPKPLLLSPFPPPALPLTPPSTLLHPSTPPAVSPRRWIKTILRRSNFRRESNQHVLWSRVESLLHLTVLISRLLSSVFACFSFRFFVFILGFFPLRFMPSYSIFFRVNRMLHVHVWRVS